jgi:hypothetical protein
MNVNFVFWVASLLLNPIFGNMANGAAVEMGIEAVAFVLFNAYVEVIYQRGTYGGMDALQGSFGFVQEHWIEWLIPNVAIGAASFFLTTPVLMVLVATLGSAGLYLGIAFGSALLMPIMLFRGHLFAALDAGIRRRVPGWKR